MEETDSYPSLCLLDPSCTVYGNISRRGTVFSGRPCSPLVILLECRAAEMPRSKYKQTYFMSAKDGPALHQHRERELNGVEGDLCEEEKEKC